MRTFDALALRACTVVLGFLSLAANAQDDCVKPLAGSTTPVAFADVERASRLPRQLGFVAETQLAEMLAALGPLAEQNLGVKEGERWALSLVQIVPISTAKAVASFHARQTTEIDGPRTTVNVVFLIATGDIVSTHFEVDGPLGYPGAEVSLGGKTMAAIASHAHALPLRLEGRDDLRPLFEDHTRVRIVRTFGAKNDPRSFVEVTLGTGPQRYTLVYTVHPSGHVSLKAVDHDELLPFLDH